MPERVQITGGTDGTARRAAKRLGPRDLPRRGRGRLVAGLVGLGVVVAGLGSSGPVPAHADQADSARRRVAAASVAGDVEHTCALLTTGAVRCWGDGHYGELGYNSRRDVGDDPARAVENAGDVPVGGKVTAITTGEDYTCALLTRVGSAVGAGVMVACSATTA